LGETPLQLAIETCTPWDSLEKLVKAFPKALTLPRCMENCPEGSPLSKAVAYHNDDVGSVGSDEAEWEVEAIDAVAGMYPFMIAAVLSHVPERRTYAETLLANKDADPAEYSKNLRIKELESLRSIYGLLRAQPRALAMYIDDETTRQVEQRRLAEATRKGNDNDSSSLDDDEEEETCTEAYVEDAPTAKALDEDDVSNESDEEEDEDDDDDASDEDDENEEDKDDEEDEANYEEEASYEEESLYTEEEEIEEEVVSCSGATSDYTEIEEVSHL
jgi:cobalamin biosynthesis protein CobT